MGQVAVNTTFTVISLAISAFALTSLDTATRLGRFLFQELFTSNKAKENSKVQGYLGICMWELHHSWDLEQFFA